MASIRDQRARGRGVEVRWRDPDGTERTRSAPNLRAAKALQREVEDAVSLGRRWEPRDASAAPDLPAVLAAYVRSRARSKESGTVQHDAYTLDVFLRFLRAEHGAQLPLTLLSRATIERWYDYVRRTPGKNKSTAPAESACQKYVRRVERAWEWAADADDFAAWVPRPRRIELRALTEAPTVAPTWAQMDACVAAAQGWLKRVLTVERYTGLRVQQVMGLRWDDLDLDRAVLRFRGELGKTREEKKGRLIPVSPHLVAAVAGWGRREGYLIESGRRGAQARVVRARDVCRAWARAGVPPDVWQRRPDHAFRKGLISGLKALRADVDAVEVLVGHKLPGQRSVYTDPTSIPMREAVALIPVIGLGAASEPLRLDALRSARR